MPRLQPKYPGEIQMKLARRTLLHGLGAVALGSAMRPAWPLDGGDRTGLDLGNRRDLLTALAKMRGATDDRLVIGYVIGARYAVPEHRAIPMMGILAATFSQYRRVSDDAFEARALEIGVLHRPGHGQAAREVEEPRDGNHGGRAADAHGPVDASP